jgi:hypothetical protein
MVTLIRGRAMRATRLDGCGATVLGPDSVVTTKGFVSVALTANSNAGTAIQVDNANGERMVDETPVPKFTNYTVEFAFTDVDPALLTLLSGQPAVLNALGTEIIGFGVDDDIDAEAVAFALEVWTGVGGAACDESGDPLYGYSVLPFVKGGMIGNVTVENGNITFPITGAQTKKGNAWGSGPYDVQDDETGTAGPLVDPIPSSRHLHFITTSVAPPTDLDGGASALGVPATGATAGIPGTWTPTNSYAPANLADLVAGASGPHGVAVTASPNTAWTTGQRVQLRDGTYAHWSSTAWVAGPA